MTFLFLSRRKFLRLGVLAGLGGIAGCGNASDRPVLRAASNYLPKTLLRTLPANWSFKPLNFQSGEAPFTAAIQNGSDLLALGDGWLNTLPLELLKPVGCEALVASLDYQAISFLENLGSPLSRCVFPIGVSPWVMLFRKGDPWLAEANNQGWQVLLDRGLKGLVVLPNSPRIILSISEQISAQNALTKLRSQALAIDDRNGLNWLLSGEARVAILPLRRCWQSLIRDPRLSVAFPSTGVPLDWTVLIRPVSSKEPFPQEWIEKGWSLPLLGKLLSIGWIPPLSQSQLKETSSFISSPYLSAAIPPKDVWSKCWSLPILSEYEKKKLEELWHESTP